MSLLSVCAERLSPVSGSRDNYGSERQDPEPPTVGAVGERPGVWPNPASERSDRPMAIMPASAHMPPPAYVDGCPECVVNVEPPRSVTTLSDVYRATYLCSDCGHSWFTDWRN